MAPLVRKRKRTADTGKAFPQEPFTHTDPSCSHPDLMRGCHR